MKLRSYSLIGIFLMSLLIDLQAQNGTLTNAILYSDEGNLLKAKEAIDAASNHDKTKALPKTWYYKGLIYNKIYSSDQTSVKEKAGDALKTSTEALLKTRELENNANGTYTVKASELLSQNWSGHINRGVAYYQSKSYENALAMYELAKLCNPNDTTAYVYTFYAATALNKTAEAQKAGDKLLSMNYTGKDILAQLIDQAMKNKNYAQALDLINNRALPAHPGNKVFLQNQTLAYIETGNINEGMAKLEPLLKAKPYDVELLTNQAVYYNALNNQDKALETYRKIVALEPHHFFANYNAAVIYFNKGKNVYDKDQPKAKEYFKFAKDHCKRAKALAVEKEDQANLSNLIQELDKLAP